MRCVTARHRSWRAAAGATGLLLVLVLLAGAAWQAVAASAERAASLEPGRLVRVGAVALHLYCTGSGKPTVIFDSGLGETLADWQLVQPVVSRRTRACSYDRAGLGASSSLRGPRDAVHLADQLDGALHAAGLAGPFVLVGHSLGGLDVRVLAARHPADVAGLVLVDSASPQDRTALGPLVARQEDEQFATTDLCSGITPVDRLRRALGWDRLWSTAGPVDSRLPPRWQNAKRDAQLRWLHGLSPACAEGYAEHAALPESAAQAAGVTSLGDLPLVVVTRGLAETWPAPIPIAATEAAWHREQAALVRLSTRGRQLVADHARHYVMLDQPEVVVTGVLDVLAELTNQHP
jgi:pimeloyl-ACP methyl ester carboxylesterase